MRLSVYRDSGTAARDPARVPVPLPVHRAGLDRD
jgi:hypothetical protein